MATAGVAGALWMVSGSPFMMENSTPKERNALFSANFGLQTLVGFFGTLIGGYLPTLFGGLMSVDAESPQAYAATLGMVVALSALSLLPVFMIKEQPRPADAEARSLLPWRNISNPGLIVRIFVPNILISMGAAILIPYMNLFFKDTFAVSDTTLGGLFAVSSVVTGTATLASPVLADRWGRIRALVMTQLTSIPFLLIIGFAPALWMASLAFWVRAALMNMGNPLYNAFAMEQVTERERATVSGLLGMSWTIGWTVGPYLSGYMQAQPYYRLSTDLFDHLFAVCRGRRPGAGLFPTDGRPPAGRGPRQVRSISTDKWRKEESMNDNIIIRTYRPEDMPALVTLTNEADAYDQDGAGHDAGRDGARHGHTQLLSRDRLLHGLGQWPAGGLCRHLYARSATPRAPATRGGWSIPSGGGAAWGCG